MGRVVFIVLVFCFGISSSKQVFATQIAVSQQDIRHDEYAKVWGLLKYFHSYPSEVNWDQQYLSDFDKIHSMNDRDEFHQFINGMIQNCGKSKGKKLVEKDKAGTELKHSFFWLDDTYLPDSTINQLVAIVKNKTKFKNKYISKQRFYAGAIYHENDYEDTSRLTPAVKSLGLARFWNAMNYYHPYLDEISDWSTSFVRYHDYLIHTKDFEAYVDVLGKINHLIQDSHGAVIDKGLVERNKPPFWIERINGQFFVSKIKEGENPKLYIGDELIEINGKKIKTMWWNAVRSTPLSFNALNHFGINHLLSSSDTLAEYTFLDKNGGSKVFKYSLREDNQLERTKIRTSQVLKDSLSGNSIPYFHLGTVSAKEVNRIMDSMGTYKSIIIDVRQHPKFSAYSFYKYLLDFEPRFHEANMNFDYPGRYLSSFNQKEGKKVRNSEKYQGDVYLLVGPETVSFGEQIVMALQNSKNVITVGHPSAGANGVATTIPLPGDVKLRYTGTRSDYVDRSIVYKKGVRLDHRVKRTMQTIYGQDEVFNYTLDLIYER